MNSNLEEYCNVFMLRNPFTVLDLGQAEGGEHFTFVPSLSAFSSTARRRGDQYMCTLKVQEKFSDIFWLWLHVEKGITSSKRIRVDNPPCVKACLHHYGPEAGALADLQFSLSQSPKKGESRERATTTATAECWTRWTSSRSGAMENCVKALCMQMGKTK